MKMIDYPMNRLGSGATFFTRISLRIRVNIIGSNAHLLSLQEKPLELIMLIICAGDIYKAICRECGIEVHVIMGFRVLFEYLIGFSFSGKGITSFPLKLRKPLKRPFKR